MDTLSFFAGALLGFGIACLGFGLLFYRYMATNTEENLKHYKELQGLVNKIGEAEEKEVVPDGDSSEKCEE
jgi:hypothetical protein